MGDILIRGADVLTLDAAGTALRGADVAVSNGLLVGVGAAPDDFKPDEIIDARHHIVMPGLYNAHMHSGTVLSRGVAGPGAPDPWFDLRITRDAQVNQVVRSAMTAEDAYWAALLAAAEMIRGGVTGFMDQYFFMDRVAQAALDSGLRANLAWCTFGDESGEIGGDVASISAFVEDWQGAGDGRIRTSFGPHSAYMCSPRFLARTAAVAARMGADIHLRLAESQEQVDLSMLAYDMTPVQLLDQNGVLDLPVVAANVAYLADFDLEILATARGEGRRLPQGSGSCRTGYQPHVLVARCGRQPGAWDRRRRAGWLVGHVRGDEVRRAAPQRGRAGSGPCVGFGDLGWRTSARFHQLWPVGARKHRGLYTDRLPPSAPVARTRSAWNGITVRSRRGCHGCNGGGPVVDA